jgi:hypothetical protein
MTERVQLARSWGIQPGESVLEVGCGQGDATIALAVAVGAEGRVVALDPASLDYGTLIAGTSLASQPDLWFLQGLRRHSDKLGNSSAQDHLADGSRSTKPTRLPMWPPTPARSSTSPSSRSARGTSLRPRRWPRRSKFWGASPSASASRSGRSPRPRRRGICTSSRRSRRQRWSAGSQRASRTSARSSRPRRW